MKDNKSFITYHTNDSIIFRVTIEKVKYNIRGDDGYEEVLKAYLCSRDTHIKG
jgi:hypothetical protein